MASKTIMVQEETYIKLLRLKQGNESFNDVILRLMERKQDLAPFAGLLSPEEGVLLENALEDLQHGMDMADQERDEA